MFERIKNAGKSVHQHVAALPSALVSFGAPTRPPVLDNETIQIGPRQLISNNAPVIGDYVKSLGPDPYVPVFERKRQPDGAGTARYAYETLALKPDTLIGPAVAVRQPDPVPVTQPTPMITLQAVWTDGIPTIAGGIYGQPLLDYNGNLSVGALPFAGPNDPMANDPYIGYAPAF